MTAFINETGLIADALNTFTINVTGSLFLTLLSFILTIIAISILMRISIEWTAILVFPMLIGIAAFYTGFFAILAPFAIYLGILVGKNFFFK